MPQLLPAARALTNLTALCAAAGPVEAATVEVTCSAAASAQSIKRILHLLWIALA
jgi:hypothetical protein